MSKVKDHRIPSMHRLGVLIATLLNADAAAQTTALLAT